MYQYFVLSKWPTINNNLVDELADVQAHLMRGLLEILPVHVVVLNAIVHQCLWIVTKPMLVVDAVAAVWMLTGLFKVEYSFDILIFELLDHLKFFNQSIT